MRPLPLIFLLLPILGCATGGLEGPNDNNKTTLNNAQPSIPSPTAEEVAAAEKAYDDQYIENIIENVCHCDSGIKQLSSFITSEKAAAKESGFIHGGEVQSATIRIKQIQLERLNYLKNYRDATGKSLKKYTCDYF